MSLNPAKVVELGAHAHMTPEQALGLCAREEWDQVIIVGYHKGDPSFVVRSSHLTRAEAVFLLEQARLHSLGVI